MANDREPKYKQQRQWLEASALAFIFPVAIALGYGWGWLMDRWLGTSPWLSYIFAGLGMIAAFRELFRFAGRNG